MHSSRVCAGIVTYNPNMRDLKKNIECIISQVDKVIIFDNSSENIRHIREIVYNYDSVELIESERNRGVAYALNALCYWAKNKDYYWILTLDQDSQAPPNLVNVLKQYVGDQVAIVSPNIIYKNNEDYSISSKKKYVEKEWVITSSSLTNLDIWEKIDGFDEKLFIDGVDYDFCVRATREGYHVICTYEVELYHELGDLKCKKLFGKILYITNHSATRKYFMSRNTIYLYKKLKKGMPIRTILKYLIKTLFFEDNKIHKIRAINRGIIDGIKLVKGLD